MATGLIRVCGVLLATAVLVATGGTTAVDNEPEGVLSAAERAAGWAPLFNGSDLSGWTTSGHAGVWGVEDGQIVTRPGEGDGWWLRTTRQYRDFELKLDFQLTPGANSGIGLRGSSMGDPAFTGLEVQVLDSAGEAPSITNCGAVYDAIAPTAMAVRPAGEWNTYRIHLVGDTLNIWLNGEQIHKDQRLDGRGFVHSPDHPSPLQDRLTTGFISLQCHGDVVRFRNLKVLDLSPDPDPGDFAPMFNGKDLTGWQGKGNATWTVEDGVVVGQNGPGHLYGDPVFTDLELRAQVRINSGGNSGLYFRAVPRGDEPDGWPLGFEAQIDNHDPKNFTGCIYAKAWPATRSSPVSRDGAWFDLRVRATGGRIQTWVNGEPMADASLLDFDIGRVALQSHHMGNRVEWKDLQVRDLSAGSHPAGRQSTPLRVFYCTHSAGYRHEVLPETRQILNDLGRRLDWLSVTVSDDVRDLTPERLAQTDVVMFYTTGSLPMGRMRAILLEWVVAGGALVGVHSATDTFADEPEYVRTIGGTFDGHPWNEQVTMIALEPDDPIVRPFLLTGGSRGGVSLSRTFTIADEIYQFKSLTNDRRVLIALDPATPGAEPGREYPIAWTREVGRGRVFYTALGHRPEAWRDDRFMQHLLAGLRWAGGLDPSHAGGAPPKPQEHR
ncbi:MAG: DUF1080 domain-containing protein [Phycisphaeraceae bacterium]|nr:DUF1080 domain-containing protein [Phycisphaeraceae bacterium]